MIYISTKVTMAISSIVNSSPTMSGNVLFDSDHGIFPPTGGSPTPPTNPAPPTAPVIASFSIDTGSVGDRVTNDNTLTLTGTAAANSTVKMFRRYGHDAGRDGNCE